jgi:parallel beta-helix repeat protein
MGVYISSGNYNVLFGNSCCANTPEYGIYATSEFLTISGNVCYYNAVSGIGIFVYGKNVLFSNTCCINAAYGLIVYQNLDYNTIVSNIALSNTIHGIYAYDTNYNTLVSNNCHINQYCGIYTYTASNNTMSCNTITNSSQVWDNHEANMTIRENSDYNNIQRNTCRAGSGSRAPSYGINIKDSNCSENLVTNNDIYNDNYGVSSLNIAAGSGTVTTPGNRTA